MSGEESCVVLDGYLTMVLREQGTDRQLYLHAQGRIYRLALTADTVVTGPGAADGLPVGPEHPVRVVGRVEGDALMPCLRARQAWPLDTQRP